MGHWVFEELRGAAVRRQPQETLLFTTEHSGEGEYAGTDTLVREIIQNALDARVETEAVRVRLALHEADEAPSEPRLAAYFARLRPALEARGIAFDGHGVPRLSRRFLVVEDFGTRGLEGDMELFCDPPPGHPAREDFYWFWRNAGRSGKTGDDLGRWGLGKTVFRAASRVGCMLGLTIRRSDGQRLVMGQAVLQIHCHEGREFQPEGYWCRGQNDRGVPLPIVDPPEVEQFCREWHLTRCAEPGLSIVVPFVAEELRVEPLLQAVAVHFFVRILRGELIVDVADRGLGLQRLDAAHLERVCRQVSWKGPKRTKRHQPPPVAFVQHCLRMEKLISTRPLGTSGSPELSREAFEPEDLQGVERRFAAGELIGVRVSLWLPRHKGPGEQGQVDVFLQRQDQTARCDAYYVREGMTLPKISSRAALRGVQALVRVESGPLARLLGDTEGPAHEDWDTSVDRPNGEWKHWKGRVKFVRRIVDALVETLTPTSHEPDFDLLSGFFPLSEPGSAPRRKPPGETPPEPVVVPPIESSTAWFQIVEQPGGFTIRRTAGVPLPQQPRLKVSLAYDLPQGDPLRHWSPLDFRLGEDDGALRPSFSGVQVELWAENVVCLHTLAEDFRFSIVGFDRHRDLFIRVEDLSGSSEHQP